MFRFNYILCLHILFVSILVIPLSGCHHTHGTKKNQFYDAPLGDKLSDRRKKFGPKHIYSTLGEFRGITGDAPRWFSHGAVDFAVSDGVNVYSPDVGEVKFYGDGSTNTGKPPVKIGHFAMHHFINTGRLEVDPKTLGDRTAHTIVVEPNDDIWVMRNGKRVKTTLRKHKFVAGVQEHPPNSGNWRKVFWFNRRFPIGQTSGPDLHTIYYNDPDASYHNRESIRNALRVFKYENSSKPVFGPIRLFAQKAPATTSGHNKRFIADTENQKSGMINIDTDKGVDVAVVVSSFAKANLTKRPGIYRVAYSIYRFLKQGEQVEQEVVKGPGNKRMVLARAEEVMFTYNGLRPASADKQLIAYSPFRVGHQNQHASYYQNVTEQKYTSFVVSNINGDDDKYWELDDKDTYPDGNYLLRIKAWNIKKAKGIGNEPDLSHKTKDTTLNILTDTTGKKRRIKFD